MKDKINSLKVPGISGGYSEWPDMDSLPGIGGGYSNIKWYSKERGI